jgi:ribonuclease P protein component
LKSATQRFPRDLRLRKTYEFRLVKKNGKRFKDHFFWMQLMKTGQSVDRPKLGIIASRRFGCAVLRNRAKRIIREAFRKNQSSFLQGFDLVVLPRRAMFKASFASFEDRFIRAIEKISAQS